MKTLPSVAGASGSWINRSRCLRLLFFPSVAGASGSCSFLPTPASLPSTPFWSNFFILLILCSLLMAPLSAQDQPVAPVPAPAEATAGPTSPELTEAADHAIERGLQFLITSQNPDGSWSGAEGKFKMAGTSLGLMAFMVKGEFPGFGRNGAALDRAKEFLLKHDRESETGYAGGMYEHGLYTLALSELWGMTANKDDNKALQTALERAVQVILRAQSPLGGWRYHARPDAGQDTSVTAMVFVSLASARQAGILVPTETIDRVVGYLRDQVWNEKTGGFGYQGNSGSTLSCTGGGAYAAQLCGMRDTEWVQASIRYLENSPKIFNREEVGYFYYCHYYAMQAMVQAGEEHYAKWYPQIRDALVGMQLPDGSWNEGKMTGYPHMTPMAVIILGTPHRYIPIYQQ